MTCSGKSNLANEDRTPYNSSMLCSPLKISALIALFLLPSMAAQALKGDSEQAIRIVADEAVRDEKSGLTVYRGNVLMNQGSIQIEADQITIYKIKIEGDKIVAEGTPAHIAQQPEPDSAMMHAWGGIIEYYRTEERMLLLKDAQLEQDGSTVRGDRIDYLINEKLVKAAADGSNTERRVEVVIPPHKLEE
jgi:lipopolysaccharide export system protein LptA